MRIGVVAILHESNTFTTARTSVDHFRADVLLAGEAIVDRFGGTRHEVGGFIDGLSDAGVEIVPLLAARAVPYGTIEADASSALLSMLDDRLAAAGALDGVLAAAHGATVSETYRDFDGYWLGRVRDYLGPDRPIVATLDAHANLSTAMVRATDALIGYRTNPHVDQYDRGRDAAALMVRAVRGEVRPTQAAAMPALAINIERQCTDEEPCRELLSRARDICTDAGAIGHSILLGFPYADVPEMGSSVVVITDDDKARAQRLADSIAAEMIQLRRKLVGSFTSIDDAVQQAAELSGPVCLLDMGDNVGGGGPGDGTLLAHALRRVGLHNALICLHDPQAVGEIGDRDDAIALRLGGRGEAIHGGPFEGEFKVIGTHSGRFEDPTVSHGAFTHFDMGRTAIVQTTRGMTFMLTSHRLAPFTARPFELCGLDPRAFRVIVAKGVNAPLAAYRPFCRHFIRVDTPGVTSADMRRLTYEHRRRPMFPFEADEQRERSTTTLSFRGGPGGRP